MNAPRSWPKSSDSISVSVRIAQLTGTNGRAAARAATGESAGDGFLAGPGLADDEHVALAVGDDADEVEDRPHPRAVPDDDRVRENGVTRPGSNVPSTERPSVSFTRTPHRNVDARSDDEFSDAIAAVSPRVGAERPGASRRARLPDFRQAPRRARPSTRRWKFRRDCAPRKPHLGTGLVTWPAMTQPHRSLDIAPDIAALIERYDRPGPRYTSYPTAVEFHDGFGDPTYRARLRPPRPHRPTALALRARAVLRVALRVLRVRGHATRKREVAATYLDYLEREIAMLAAALGGRRRVVQYHWGGGTPTYLSRRADRPPRRDRRTPLRHRARRRAGDRDRSARDDARADQLLRRLGFNRLSFGVQDFAPAVQEAIQRHQPETDARSLLGTRARPGSTRSTSI